MFAVPSRTLAAVAAVMTEYDAGPVAGGAESQIVAETQGVEGTVEVGRIAGDDKPGSETVRERRCVVSVVGGQVIHGSVDIASGVLVEYAGNQMPVRAEVLLDPCAGDLGTHARQRTAGRSRRGSDPVPAANELIRYR